jgi:hypothetical protein
MATRDSIAFSSEVDTGSREENASKQLTKARFWFNQNRTGFSETVIVLTRMVQRAKPPAS